MKQVLRILFAHNAYQQRGGEDSVVDSEISLLREHGHPVETYRRHNNEIGVLSRPALARQTLWSARTVDEFGRLIAEFRPDVIHVHNTFPLISPSVYWEAVRAHVPVVQTLHNFRLLCLNALFLREGRVCEDCLGHLPWRGVTRRCYRGSIAQSAVLAGMLVLHRGLGTYTRKVTRYIALNEFCRQKFIDGGLPADKVVVKPNFVDWATPPATPQFSEGDMAERTFLFVGRLSPEKGIEVLRQAMHQAPEVRLRVAGDGPDEPRLRALPNVTLLGPLPGGQVQFEMTHALALVLPSVSYENFPRTLVEAFASGLPVIASRLGAMAELIDDGETGLLFEPGNPADLAAKLRWALQHPDEMRAMGANARRVYEAKYTPEINYRQLLAIYQEAISEEHHRS